VPWKTEDVERHKKGLSDKDKRQWVATANSALKACLADDGDTEKCEGRAIRIANAAVAEADKPTADNMAEDDMGPSEAPAEWVPYGIYTFVDLRARREVEAKAQNVRTVTEQFKQMVGNILDNYSFEPEGMKAATPQERIAKIRALLTEMEAELNVAFEEPTTEAEPVGEPEVLAEATVGRVIRLAEGDNRQGPLTLIAELIRPGWGNTKDGHYYPDETLRGDSIRIWEGTKMHEVDHREDQRSNENWVSTVGPHVGYSDSGGAIFQVAVHDPKFAERARNLAELGLLDKLECSILGDGLVRKGFERDGRKGSLVERFTVAKNVDWVSHAGAGGRAVGLAESGTPDARQEVNIVKVDRAKLMEALRKALEEAKAEDAVLDELVQEAIAEAEVTETVESVVTEPVVTEPVVEPTVEAEPVIVTVSAERVRELCMTAKLPDALTGLLAEIAFLDEAAVTARIAEQKAWLQQTTRAGRPWALSEGDQPAGPQSPLSSEEFAERSKAVITKYTGRQV